MRSKAEQRARGRSTLAPSSQRGLTRIERLVPVPPMNGELNDPRVRSNVVVATRVRSRGSITPCSRRCRGMKPPPPRLDPRFLGVDIALVATIDAVLLDDRRMQRHVLEILRRQGELQRASDESGWDAYLHLEMAVNARRADALVRVARWAWAAGREHERRRRGS
jgi:hypothetical protein